MKNPISSSLFHLRLPTTRASERLGNPRSSLKALLVVRSRMGEGKRKRAQKGQIAARMRKTKTMLKGAPVMIGRNGHPAGLRPSKSIQRAREKRKIAHS